MTKRPIRYAFAFALIVFAAVALRAPSADEIPADEMAGPPPGKWQGLKGSGIHIEWFIQHMDEVRRYLTEDVLGLPSAPPPVPPVTRYGTLESDAFTLEKIELVRAPGMPITANLYVPKSVTGKVPAVLNLHGNWPGGKRSPQVRMRCAQMARMGLVAMAIDAYGVPGPGNERGHLGGVVPNEDLEETIWNTLVASGINIAQISVADARAAISYLVSRPEVDPERIVLVGGSWGATQAILTTIVDRRVYACAGFQFGSTFTRFPNNMSNELIPGVLRYARRPEMLALTAPRPLLLVQHFHAPPFIHEAVAAVYERKGAAGHFEYVERIGRHDFQKPYREILYRWLNGLLLDKDEPIEEDPFFPFADKDLFCHPDGRVGADALTIDDLIARATANAGYASRLPASAEKWPGVRAWLRSSLCEAVGYEPGVALDVPLATRIADGGPPNPAALLETVASGPWFALGVSSPAPGAARLLVVDRSTRDGNAASLLPGLTAGDAVGVLSLAGLERVYHANRGDWDFSALDARQIAYGGNAMSILYGDPHIWRKVRAIRDAVARITAETGIPAERIELVGIGESADLLVVAAAVEDSLTGPLHLTDALVSRRSAEGHVPMLATTPPNVATVADVGDLLALSAPRRIQLDGGHLTDGRALDMGQLFQELATTYRVYNLLEASDSLRVGGVPSRVRREPVGN